MFPMCAFAGHVKPGDKRFCRLTPQAKLVTMLTCKSCPHAGSFSTALEPITTPPLIDETQFPACVHRGDRLRMDTVKAGCCGTEAVQVAACAVHRECTIKRCLACPDRVTPTQVKLGPLTGPANLMMFVYPKRETREVWERQQETIRESIGKFDGKKVCAIAVDDSTCESEIDRHLWDEVIELPNDPQRRELVGWRWAMSVLKGEPGFTVRLHAKGAWRGTAEQHMARWWELGYKRLLGVDRVRESLQTHVITGPFRRNVPAANLGVQWHYSGSFYAFRNAEIFGKEWDPVGKAHPGWYVEAWPALVATHELAGSVGWDGVGDLYQSRAWREVPHVAATRKESLQIPPATKLTPPEVIAFPAMPRQKKPSVSIIVPAWNEATRIEKCLRSIIAQTFQDFEVIIVDDGSTDGTADVVRQLIADDGRFSLITKEHSGIGNTLNAGFAQASADLQTWTSADSWVFPEYLATLKAALDANPAAVMAYSDWQHIDGATETIVREPEFNRKELQASCRIGVCWLFRRSAKEQAGPYVAEPCEDYYMHLMLAGIGDFIHVPEVLGVWRNHSANTSTRTCNPTKWVHSVTVKVKARWQQAKYRVAYVCPNMDAASVGWLHASAFNDLSSDFAVRHILGDVTHVTPGVDLRLRVQFGDYPIEQAAREVMHEADIIHINSAFPDADADLWEIIKGKPLVIHHHATRQQWDADRIRKWIEAGTPVLSCTPGHPLTTWIPNVMPINPAFPMQYDSYYQPLNRDWSKLSILCHHNYEAGKGVTQMQDIIDGMNEIRFGGKLHDLVRLSLSTVKKLPLFDHLELKRPAHIVIDTISHGYTGMASWESMAMQQAVLCRMDGPSLGCYSKTFGSVPPIFNVRTPDDVVATLENLIRNPKKAEDSAAINREWILANYTAEKIIPRYESIYKSVLKK